jgi:hypothetical protein
LTNIKLRIVGCRLEHDPEKSIPAFLRDKRRTRLRGDHAQSKTWSAIHRALGARDWQAGGSDRYELREAAPYPGRRGAQQ